MESVASGGIEPIVIIWDVSSGDIISTLHGHRERIYCVCFSPCGSFLASASRDRTIILWDCHSWTTMHTFTGHKSPVFFVSFNGTGDLIASTSEDGTVRVWSLTTRMEELKIETESKVYSVSFNSAGDTLAVSFVDVVNLYDVKTGQLERRLIGHECAINPPVKFSQDSSMLVSGSVNDSVILWDVVADTVLRELWGHSDVVRDVSFSGDASKIVSSSFDRTARIWDVATGECLLVLEHNERVFSVCFSEDDCKVITGCKDGTIIVWDSNTGEELRTLRGHSSSVITVSYRPSVCGSYI